MKAAVWIVAAALILLLGLFGFYVWPTPYRYYHMDPGPSWPMREHRITGYIDRLTPTEGWVTVTSSLRERLRRIADEMEREGEAEAEGDGLDKYRVP